MVVIGTPTVSLRDAAMLTSSPRPCLAAWPPSRPQSGPTTVEILLIAPLMLALVFLVLELCWGLATQSLVHYGACQGARGEAVRAQAARHVDAALVAAPRAAQQVTDVTVHGETVQVDATLEFRLMPLVSRSVLPHLPLAASCASRIAPIGPEWGDNEVLKP